MKIIILERGKKKRIVTIDGDKATIGRTPKNGVVLPKPNVSKLHARLKLDGDKLMIEDMGSTNGTYLNGERIEKPEAIDLSDKIFIGDFILKVMSDTEKSAERKIPGTEKTVDEEPVLTDVDLIDKDNLPPPPNEEELELILEDEDIEEEPPEELDIAEDEPEVAEDGIPHRVEEISQIDVTDKVTVISPHTQQDAMEETLLEYQRVLSEVALRANRSVFKDKSVPGKDLTDEEWSYYSDRLMQVVESMRRSDEIPKNIDPYALSQDILSEYSGFGPLDDPLADETVRTIHVTGCNRIFVLKGYRWERVAKVFSSTAALTKIMAKLVKQANIKDVSARRYLRGRMEDGILLQLLLPPLSRKHTIILEKGTLPELTLSDLLKAKTVDAKIVDLLDTAINQGDNIIVCGPKHSGKTVLLNAILPMIPLDANVVVMQGKDELTPPHVNMVQLNKESLDSEPTHTAFIVDSLSPDWVVFEDLELNDVKVMLELIVSGRQSIIAVSASANCQACLDRLLLELIMLYPALTHEDRLRMIYSTVDLIISMERIPGTGSRVTRITRLRLEDNSPFQEVLLGDK